MKIEVIAVTHKNSPRDVPKLERLLQESLTVGKFHSEVRQVNFDQFSREDVTGLDLLSTGVTYPLARVKWAWFLKSGRRFGQLHLLKEIIRSSLSLIFGLFSQILSPISSRFAASRIGGTLRLMNIAASHCDAIRGGLSRGADYILVIEDDAIPTSTSDLIEFFQYLRVKDPMPGQFHMIDLSNSFSFKELGVEKLILPGRRFGNSAQRLVSSSLPFTNTCCAIAYDRNFATAWLKFLEQKLKSTSHRGVPIDWLLNLFIIETWPQRSLVVQHIDPGIFVQGSLNT